jgi:hypothetical protein
MMDPQDAATEINRRVRRAVEGYADDADLDVKMDSAAGEYAVILPAARYHDGPRRIVVRVTLED